MNDSDDKIGFGCFVVFVLMFLVCAFTQPGQVVWGAILNNTVYAKQAPAPVSSSITNSVVEPVKSGDVLVFPKGTLDWRVIAYAFNSGGGHSADVTVIEYWCRFEGDPAEQWTRCYPAVGTDRDS